MPNETFLRLLTPLSWVYGHVMQARARLYESGYFQQTELPGTVISIGNLEVGGTGKSPVVIALAKHLRQQDKKVAILTRGYKSGLGKDDSMTFLGTQILIPPLTPGAYFADEARMQAALLEDVPVIAGANRGRAAQRFLKVNPAPDYWLLDDGFQHLAIKRQFDIVLLDAKAPFADNRVLPAGRLRESVNELKRAHLVLFTRSDSTPPPAAALETLAGYQIPWYGVVFRENEPLQVAGVQTSVTALDSLGVITAIAKGDRFIAALKSKGLPVTTTLSKGDHETFNQGEVKNFASKCQGLLTTQKDYWRNPSLFAEAGVPVYVVPLEARLPPGVFEKINQG